MACQPSRVILCLEFKKLNRLYIYIYIFGVIFLYTVIQYQLFVSNTNNLYIFVWFQVFLFKTNDYMVSSNYFYLIIFICWHTVTWFQVTNNHHQVVLTAWNFLTLPITPSKSRLHPVFIKS